MKTAMTPQEARGLWVEALRSRRYTQGHGLLKAGEKYCCLGVACDLYQQHVGGLVVRGRGFSGAESFNDRINFLPLEVQEWLGLESSDGGYGPGKALIADNDLSQHDFNTIADTIEREWPTSAS